MLSNLAAVSGALLSLVIWSTAEGFGGPYVAGSTDVGAAIIYALVFAGLFLARAGLYLGLDRRTGVLGATSAHRRLLRFHRLCHADRQNGGRAHRIITAAKAPR